MNKLKSFCAKLFNRQHTKPTLFVDTKLDAEYVEWLREAIERENQKPNLYRYSNLPINETTINK